MLSLWFLIMISSHGATLASFSFTDGSLANDAPGITGLSVSQIDTDSGFNTFTSVSGLDSAAQISGASSFFSGPTTQAMAENAVFFTITALDGYTFSINTFSFTARSTGDAPADIGFTIGANVYDFSSSYSNDSNITPISSSSLGLSGMSSVVIAIQGWNATGSSALQLDNLNVTGTVIPEPSIFCLVSLSALTLLRRRR